MRKGFVKSLGVMLVVAAAFFSFSVCAYADREITVNGEKVSKGDTVTYEYYMSGISDPVEAVGSFIEYDQSALQYVDGSIGFDVLNNAMYNIDNGIVYFSAINVIDGYDIKDKKLIVTISFKVSEKASGALTIKNTIDEMFTMTNEEDDLTPDDYKSEETITVNTYSENTAPYLGMDANNIEEYITSNASENTSSTFSELLEGNRNENVSYAENNDDKSKSEALTSQENQTVQTADEGGELVSLVENSSQNESSVSDGENNGSDEKSSAAPIVIAVTAVVIIVACAAVVVSSKKKEE